MKEIPLTRGKTAIVDDADYEWLSQWKWCAGVGGSGTKCYAVRHQGTGIKKRKMVLMHRIITNTPDGMECDHINGNSLDNRRENLRICTHMENIRNRPLSKNNTTGYKGVVSRRGRYMVTIRLDYKRIYLGDFDTAEEAACAYDEAAKRYYGVFAKLNFPNE
jgi:hypothetical protein